MKGVRDGGVEKGERRMLADACWQGGPPGDLYVFLNVKPSKDFKREGADIYSNVMAEEEGGGGRRRQG